MRREATAKGQRALERAAAWHQTVTERTGALEKALAERRKHELAANREGVTIDRIRDRLGCARSTVIEDLKQARADQAKKGHKARKGTKP